MYDGFPLELLELLRCQGDGAPLYVARGAVRKNAMLHGEFRCVRCQTVFVVVNGVVDLLGAQSAPDPVACSEIHARDQQAGAYDVAFTATRTAVELTPVLAELQPLHGTTLLELGRGTGRATVQLARQCRRLLALDYSKESLCVLASKLGGCRRVGLLLADATKVRLAPGAFDRALTTQVIEHVTPDGRRAELFSRVHRSLRRDGVLVCAAYHYDLRRRLGRAAREGRHPSGIFFRFFTVSELKAEIAPFFQVDCARPIQIPVPLVYRHNLRVVGEAARLLERVPVLRQLGHLVLLRGTKRGG